MRATLETASPSANLGERQTTAARRDRPAERLHRSFGNAAVARALTGPLAAALDWSPGYPLDLADREFFESRFKRPLGHVRLHLDPASAAAADHLCSSAFSVGSDLYFARGAYDPATSGGRGLLAHELSHALQPDRSGASQDEVSSEGAAAEIEAARNAQVIGQSVAGGDLIVAQSRQAKVHRAPTPSITPSSMPVPKIPGPPVVTVDLTGMRFLPVRGTMLVPGPGRPQVVAIILSRLVGVHATPDLVAELSNDMERRLAAKEISQTGHFLETLTHSEPCAPIIFFNTEAIYLIRFLKDRHLQVGLSDEQQNMLLLLEADENAWKELVAQSNGIPAWYTVELFRREMMSQGDLLDAYRRASDKYAAEPTDASKKARSDAAAAILTALLPAIQVMELIRDDALLVDTPGYVRLWPSNAKAPSVLKLEERGHTKGQGHVTITMVIPAAPNRQPDTSMAAAFLAYARSVPKLLQRAAEPDGTAARQRLLEYFDRFATQTAHVSPEQIKLMAQPGRYHQDPIKAELSSSPPLTPPSYLAAWTTDYTFAMKMHFEGFEMFLLFSYEFEVIKVPDDKVKSVADASRLKGETPRFGDVAALRYGRTGFYAYEDITRMTSNLEKDFGSAGSSVSLAAIGGVLSYAGTTIKLAFQWLTSPQDEISVAFPDQGFYLVRCTAIQLLEGDEFVAHAPSVAYMPVFVRDPAEISQETLGQVVRSRGDALARIAEIKGQLEEARRGQKLDTAKEDELKKELDRLTKLTESVGGSLDQQIKELQERENEKAEGSREREQLKKERERLVDIKGTRDDRAKGRTGEQLQAVFTGDEGQTLPLLLEAFKVEDATPNSVTYSVSDLTTPKSDDATRSAASRSEAIIAAVIVILEGIHGYGRGQVSIEIDRRTYIKRIAASEGSILTEALSNVAQVLSIAAVLAAPFTAGESLVLMVPAGLIGAIPSAYRVLSRIENNTFHFDMDMAMDLINIVGSAVGAAEVLTPLRMVRLTTTLMVIGVGANGTGILLMGAEVLKQIDEINNDPTLTPGQRQARLMQVLGGAMLNVGIMVGAALAAKGRAQERRQAGEGTAAAEKATPKDAVFEKWEDNVSPETREELARNPAVEEQYRQMDPEVRKVLTVCESICIPIDPRPSASDIARIKKLLSDLGLSGDDPGLREYLHWNKQKLTAAIDTLVAAGKNKKAIQAVLEASIAKGSTVGPAAKAKGVWQVTRADHTIVIEYTTGRHGDIKTTATEGFFQSHHGIQDAWAQEVGIPGYSREDAPALLIRDSYAGTPHQTITSRQSARADGRGSRTYSQERQNFLADMEAALVPKDVATKVLGQNDAYFGKLYNDWKADLVAKGATRADAAATLRSVFGTWNP